VEPKPTRDRLLDAAAAIMRDAGYAKTRTRHVAERAGYSEATLFKHFPDKTALVVAVLRERTPAFEELTGALSDHRGSVADGLTRIARAAIEFYTGNFPMLASLFTDQALLAAHAEGLHARDTGPHKVNEAVHAWLGAEVTSGRVDPTADLVAATGLLLGACMQHAFLGHLGWTARRADARAARAFAQTVARAVAL